MANSDELLIYLVPGLSSASLTKLVFDSPCFSLFLWDAKTDDL